MLLRDKETLDFFRIPVPKGLFFTIIIPEKLQPYKPELSIEEVLKHTANLGSFIYAMYNSDLNLISRSLNSSFNKTLHYELFPVLNKIDSILTTKALSFGSLRNSSTFFILSSNSIVGEELEQVVSELFKSNKIIFQSFVSTVNYEGCEIK
jgi:homoserine kinase